MAHLLRFVKNATRLSNQAGLPLNIPRQLTRNVSLASTSNLDVSIDDKGVCKLSMKKKPVNVLSTSMIKDLRDVFRQLHTAKDCKAVILTSSVPGIFSAGLDIEEMQQGASDESRFHEYWSCLLEMVLTMYSLRPLLVAAINGMAPAAGCLLALTADHRIMARDDTLRIGISAPRLGIDVPSWLCEMYIGQCGVAEALRSLPYAHLYSAEEAHRVGLVEELCAPMDLLDVAQIFIDRALLIPEDARHTTKMHIRAPIIERINAGKHKDLQHKIQLMKSEKLQQHLAGYLRGLSKRNKK